MASGEIVKTEQALALPPQLAEMLAETKLAVQQAVASHPELVREAQAVEQQVISLKVRDADSYSDAVELGNQIKQALKKRELGLQTGKRVGKGIHQFFCNMETEQTAPLERARKHLDNEATTYRREQERLDQLRRQQEEAEARRRIEENRRAQAAAAEAAGKAKLAEVIKAAPIVTPKVEVASTVPVVSGTRKTERWHARVIDAALVPREWCDPSDGHGGNRLNEYARKNGEKVVGTVPGVEFYSESSTF